MRRHAIRLETFDYRSPGIYLITTVTVRSEGVFGQVRDGEVVPSSSGRVAYAHIAQLSQHRPTVQVVESMVMPDHLHLILRFVDFTPCGLGAVVGAFKAGITRDLNRLSGTPGRGIWQDNYWERVVRNAEELQRLCRYLRNNPRRWWARYGSG